MPLKSKDVSNANKELVLFVDRMETFEGHLNHKILICTGYLLPKDVAEHFQKLMEEVRRADAWLKNNLDGMPEIKERAIANGEPTMVIDKFIKETENSYQEIIQPLYEEYSTLPQVAGPNSMRRFTTSQEYVLYSILEKDKVNIDLAK